MLLPVVVIITFLVAGIAAYMVLSFFTARGGGLEERLDEIRKERAPAGAPELDIHRREGPKWQKTAESVSSAVPMSPKTKLKYKRMLIQAGYRKGNALAVFIGAKLILAAVLFVILFAYVMSVKQDPMTAFALGVLGAVAGLLLPNVWLNEKLRSRKTEIFYTLPDVLDLLTVCVEAGLGLDASIIKIIEERQFSKKVLAEEFRIVSQETRAGKPRSDALRDLGERTGVDDLKTLVALLIQADRLGASLARSLRVHSDSLRTKRRQMAEEAAAKTSIKLIFPLAFFIFPALLVVLLGPAVIRIFETLMKQG